MYIGPHVSKREFEHVIGRTEHNILNHIKAAKDHALKHGFNIKVAGIFVAGPQGYNVNIKDHEMRDLYEYFSNTDMKLCVHGKYADNSLWKADTKVTGSLRHEIGVAVKCKADNFVVHLPDGDIGCVYDGLSRLGGFSKHIRLMLETPATTKNKAYYNTPEKIGKLFRRLHQNVGICIDSAHLWVGEVSFREYEETKKMLEEVLVQLSLNRNPIMFHLNDSGRPFGTGPDVHAPLGGGHIWKDMEDHKKTGIMAILETAQKTECPVVLERHPLEWIESDYHYLSNLIGSNTDDIKITNG